MYQSIIRSQPGKFMDLSNSYVEWDIPDEIPDNHIMMYTIGTIDGIIFSRNSITVGELRKMNIEQIEKEKEKISLIKKHLSIPFEYIRPPITYNIMNKILKDPRCGDKTINDY